MNPIPDQPDSPRPVPGGEEIQSLLQSVAAQTAEWQRQAGMPLTELLANWIIPQYLQAARDALATLPAGPERLKLLRQMASDAVALQRGASANARLQLDREKLELDRQKHQDALAAAAQPPPPKRPDYLRPLTDAERNAIIDKVDDILGI